MPHVDKGPEDVLRALLSGNEEEARAALEFMREAFRERFGRDPEELTPAEQDDTFY